jgi:hypothetical protein
MPQLTKARRIRTTAFLNFRNRSHLLAPVRLAHFPNTGDDKDNEGIAAEVNMELRQSRNP